MRSLFCFAVLLVLNFVKGQQCYIKGAVCCAPLRSVYCQMIDTIKCCSGNVCQFDEGSEKKTHCVVGSAPSETWGAPEIAIIVVSSIVFIGFSTVLFCFQREFRKLGRPEKKDLDIRESRLVSDIDERDVVTV